MINLWTTKNTTKHEVHNDIFVILCVLRAAFVCFVFLSV